METKSVVVLGKIKRLYPDLYRCNIEITPINPGKNQNWKDFIEKYPHGHPNNPYLELELDHQNYNSIYSLLLSSALNNLVVRFRCSDYRENEIPSNKIQYIYIDLPQE